MNFRPELAQAVMDGRKTVTRRLANTNPRSPWHEKVCAYRVGQSVAICPGRGRVAIGRATVVGVRFERLGRLDDTEAEREGFADADAFVAAFAAINGRYEPDAQVWRIELADPVAAIPQVS